MKENEQLKPCPFCGGEAIIMENHANRYIACNTKGCIVTCDYKNEGIATRMWNTRPTQSPVRAILDDVKNAETAQEEHRREIDIKQKIAEDFYGGVTSAEGVVEEFNKFLKKWTGNNYPHLIDTDENDGERFRELLRTHLQPKAEE